MVQFCDIHAHLDDASFDEDREAIILAAKQKGCVAIINNAIDVPSMEKILSYSQKYDICKCAFGLYPDTVLEMDAVAIESALSFIEAHASDILAIGEIGLDYKWTVEEEKRALQRVYFEKQLVLAQKLNKPVILHTRNAESDVFECLEKVEQKRVVMHCFCGSKKLIQEGVKRGYYFSVPPKVISDQQFQMLVSLVPMSLLLTETDSPYLHYEKGRRNDPSVVVETIEKIASLKGLDSYECANLLLSNYLRVFMLK